jgi:hypothetical protein
MIILAIIGVFVLFWPSMTPPPALAACQAITAKVENLKIANSFMSNSKNDIAFQLEGSKDQYIVRVSSESVDQKAGLLKDGDTVTIWVAGSGHTVYQMQKDQNMIVSYDDVVKAKSQGNWVYYIVGAFCILIGVVYGFDYVRKRNSYK